MIIKRIPLFIVGLLYGAVINSAVLGIGYGVYAAGVAIGGILQACCRGGNGCLIGNSDAGLIIGAVVGIIILGAAVMGFAVGVLYGLLTGSWHCAMDFYNNGFVKGLTSPFRFLAAKWSNDMNNNPGDLAAYYASTDIDFFEKKKQAKEKIERKAKAVHTFLDVLVINEEIKNENGMPKRLSQMVAKFLISPDDPIQLPDDMRGSVAVMIESKVLPEVKPPSRIVSDFFTVDETVAIIQRCPFFQESNRGAATLAESKRNERPIVSSHPKVNDTLQLIRRFR